MSFAKPLITIATCGAAQLCAIVLGHIIWTSNGGFLFALCGAICAAIGICLLRRTRTEIIILNALFPIAMVAAFSGDEFVDYSSSLLILTVFLLLLFIPTLYSGVPYYPTHRKVYEAIGNLLPSSPEPFEFIDLGCGDGRLLAYLARNFPNGRFYGCELSPLAWLFALVRCLPYRSRVKIAFKDLWSIDVSRADFVYNFLAPPVMSKLWMKLSVEAKPTALLISNAFAFPVAPIQTIEFDGDKRSLLFLYGENKATGRVR